MARVFQTGHITGYDVTRFGNLHATRPLFVRLGNHAKTFSAGKHEKSLERFLQCFQQTTDALPHTIEMTCYRISCKTNSETPLPRFPPSDVDSLQQKVQGTLCMSRENVTGGVYAFKMLDGATIFRELVPGELYVFPPSQVTLEYRTSISVYPDPTQEGFIDLVYFQGMLEDGQTPKFD